MEARVFKLTTEIRFSISTAVLVRILVNFIVLVEIPNILNILQIRAVKNVFQGNKDAQNVIKKE